MKNPARIFFVCLWLAALAGCLHAQPSAETVSDGVSPPEIPPAASGEAEPPQPVLDAPTAVIQGDVLAVFVSIAEGGIHEAVAELTDGAGKKVLSFTGFRFPSESFADRWTALGGISSVQAPGNYSLAVNVTCEDGRLVTLRADVEILRRDFVYEDIPLNQAMSSLRADSDPRKTAEARELWALLTAVNLPSVYHAGKLALPVAEGFRETSFFGDRRTFLYTDGGKANSIHYGLDYATPRGTPVHSSGTGKVVMAKERILTGFSIVIEHLPGVYSLYYHLDKL
ncbi:MAG: M23 family metallopeptidase, partial [Spirochaetales bacterium]|nr:M23 family metallopeptidase [Spirochaetales bacterium]